MKLPLIILLGVILFHPTLTSAETPIRQETLQVTKTSREVTISSHIQGDQNVDYRIDAQSGQTMTVEFSSGHRAAYFNVLSPGADAAIFNGSISGNHFTKTLSQDGVHTIRVYLMRSAARRNESAKFKLKVYLSGSETQAHQTKKDAPTASVLSNTLELQGIRFLVTCANEGSQNELQIQPSGLEHDNSPIVRTIDGTATGAEVADLNADGSPEIYVYVTSAGSGSYGSVVAYAANRKKSLSEIYLPPLSEDKKAAQGYMGHDQFAVLAGRLGRRFPIYRPGDTNAAPTGGTRRVQYRLVPGEASWILKLDKVDEF